MGCRIPAHKLCHSSSVQKVYKLIPQVSSHLHLNAWFLVAYSEEPVLLVTWVTQCSLSKSKTSSHTQKESSQHGMEGQDQDPGLNLAKQS